MATPRAAPASRIFIVECYAPGGARAEIEAAARRARISAAEGSAEGIAYLGALLVAEDELVFHVFEARRIEAVRETARRSLLSSERIVESVVLGIDPTSAIGNFLASSPPMAPRRDREAPA